MGWRFRRRVKVAPGVWVNLGKRGASWSFGGRGYTVNVGKRGVRRTIGLPGTGLSYTSKGCGGCLLPMVLLCVVPAGVALTRRLTSSPVGKEARGTGR